MQVRSVALTHHVHIQQLTDLQNKHASTALMLCLLFLLPAIPCSLHARALASCAHLYKPHFMQCHLYSERLSFQRFYASSFQAGEETVPSKGGLSWAASRHRGSRHDIYRQRLLFFPPFEHCDMPCLQADEERVASKVKQHLVQSVASQAHSHAVMIQANALRR